VRKCRYVLPMKTAAAAVLLSAALILTSCAAQPTQHSSVHLAKSTVSGSSTPAFLSSPQTAADRIGQSIPGIKSGSIRYQATVHGTKVYLGVDAAGNVRIINTLGPGWHSGGSFGNSVFEAGLPDGTSVQYVPQGAATKTLAGWKPLSKYLIAQKG
jgi:hypothetical protein